MWPIFSGPTTRLAIYLISTVVNGAQAQTDKTLASMNEAHNQRRNMYEACALCAMGGIIACCNNPNTLPSLLQRLSESVSVLVSSLLSLAICCLSALLLRREGIPRVKWLTFLLAAPKKSKIKKTASLKKYVRITESYNKVGIGLGKGDILDICCFCPFGRDINFTSTNSSNWNIIERKISHIIQARKSTPWSWFPFATLPDGSQEHSGAR